MCPRLLRNPDCYATGHCCRLVSVESSVVDVCSKSGKASPLAMTSANSEIYILSKNYPEIVASRLDCAVSVQSKPGVRLKFSSVFMELHPRTLRAGASEETTAAAAACAFDYVQLTPSIEEAQGSARRFSFCGSDVVDFVSNATTEVRFVTGPDPKHYGGFVIRVTGKLYSDTCMKGNMGNGNLRVEWHIFYKSLATIVQSTSTSKKSTSNQLVKLPGSYIKIRQIALGEPTRDLAIFMEEKYQIIQISVLFAISISYCTVILTILRFLCSYKWRISLFESDVTMQRP